MEKKLAPTAILENLKMFTGTENFYRDGIGCFVYTDGVQYMAESCEAYWLLTDAGIQSKALMQKSSFVKMTLTCDGNVATAEYCDGNGKLLHEHRYTFSDFPLDILTLYFTDNTLLLPSEY